MPLKVTPLTPQTPTTPFHEWRTPEEYASEFPHLATVSAILWDIVHRHENGLAEADGTRKVGRRFLVHRIRYSEFRLGERPAGKRGVKKAARS